MKIFKWLIFSGIFFGAFLFLFAQVSLKFMVFHMLLLLIFFFPFYLWVHSLQSLLVVIAFFLALGVFSLWSLPKLPEKKLSLSISSSSLAVEPTLSLINFQWGKRFYAYNFQKTELVREKSNLKETEPFRLKIFSQYYRYSLMFMDKLKFQGISLYTGSLVLWLLSIILIALIFSYPGSLLVSYSNIFVMIPYTFFLGENLFLRSDSVFLLYGQIVFIGILSFISIYRVKT